MRIALVTDYYPPTLGGVQTAVVALASALSAAGHEVTVFCPLASPSTGAAVVGLPVSRVFRPDGYPFAWPPRRVTALLRREFAARAIEVVHTHSEMFAALGGIRAAHDLGIPVVHTMHGRIDVYTAKVLPAPALTMPILAALHGRQVSHRNLPVRGDSSYTATAGARRMWRLMLAQSRASAHVIVPSQHFARRLIDQGVATPITVLSNGLEERVLDGIRSPRARVLAPDGPMRVIWVGRLSPEKRPEVFAEAARAFGQHVTAEMFGDGIARGRLSGPAVLRGSVPHDEVILAMATSHLLVSSSLDFDNQPMVVLEAIATGLPVLYCDPDLAEVVPAGGGFLAETPDAAGIVSAVERLQRHPSLVSEASAAMLAAAGSVAQRVEPVIDVYEQAIAATR